MEHVNKIINECGISKVKIAKYLGVSRQMLYNYLVLNSLSELPKDKQNKLLFLFGANNEDELANIKVDEAYISQLENRVNEGINDNINRESIADLRGLGKKEQELLTDVFTNLNDILFNDDDDTVYGSLKYIHYYLQTMSRVPELKYILAYMAKNNSMVPVNEFLYDEDKQYTFEGILYSAMTLYTNGGASKNKVSESHRKFEAEIESKNEEKLSRTQELTSLKALALSELGYSAINESNAKEVFEKIAEIMSRKF